MGPGRLCGIRYIPAILRDLSHLVLPSNRRVLPSDRVLHLNLWLQNLVVLLDQQSGRATSTTSTRMFNDQTYARPCRSPALRFE